MNQGLFRRVLVLLILTIPLLVTQLASVEADVTVGFAASSFSTAYSNQRKIVRNSRGELFVVYLKAVQNQSQVFVATSVDNGTSWHDLGRVSEGDFESVRTAIAIDSKDNLHVVWTKFVSEYGQIYYRSYDRAQGTWSHEQALTSGPAYSGFPSVAGDSNDLIHVAWYGYDGRAYQIFYSRYDGFSWTPPRQLSQGFPDSVNPAIAIDSNNVVHVAWYKNNGRTYQIYVVSSIRDWETQVVISSGETDSYNPTIAIDRQNTVYVVWDKQVEGFTQLFYSRFNGTSWTRQSQLTFGRSAAANPTIAVDAAGDLVVFYDKSDGEIYTLRYTGAWGPETRVTSNGGNIFPSVRWSFYNNHQDAWPSLDLVWSHQVGQNYEIRYEAIQSKQAAVQPEASTTFPIILMVAVIPLIALSYMIVRRRRTRRLDSRQAGKRGIDNLARAG